MKINKSVEQAIYVLLILALQKDGEPLKSRILSAHLKVSDSYLKKILMKLKKAAWSSLPPAKMGATSWPGQLALSALRMSLLPCNWLMTSWSSVTWPSIFSLIQIMSRKASKKSARPLTRRSRLFTTSWTSSNWTVCSKKMLWARSTGQNRPKSKNNYSSGRKRFFVII